MARTPRPRTLAAAALAALSLGCTGPTSADADPADGAGASGAPRADGAAEAGPEGPDGAPDAATDAADSDGAEGEGADRADETALREEAARVLDDWHLAASEVDQDRYLGHLAPDAVFMGTDRIERWDLAAFRGYVEEHFGEGRGWTYVPSDRHVLLGPSGDVAWFDERLTNDSYGDLRGTGALRRDGETWRIVHYSMTYTIPNDVAPEVVGVIRRDAR